jgi:hypothetical protein
MTGSAVRLTDALDGDIAGKYGDGHTVLAQQLGNGKAIKSTRWSF